MWNGILLAGETASVGAGQRGWTTSLGYDASHLSYREYVNGILFDKDTGWLNGGFFEARYDNKIAFVRGTFDVAGSISVTYHGAIQTVNGPIPFTMTQSQLFYQTEVDLGYKALNFNTATLAPYAAFGYRYWVRGQDNLPDFREAYTWWYGAVGANFAYRYEQWLFGLDAAVELPISSEMTTNIAGTVDNATFELKFRPGFRVEAPVSYDVYKGKGMNLFVFGTLYYQLWNVGASDTITLTHGGVPVGTAFEPQSSTGIAGLRLGIGVNF